MSQDGLQEQILLALSQQETGWDFSWLSARSEEEPLPWDYSDLVKNRMRGVQAMLDLGTGGGEFLASLAPLPIYTAATEGYAPFVPIARERLEPLGVQVIDMSAGNGVLPFEDNTFELVIDRHEGLRWSEVGRILRPGGMFITQQVGGQNMRELNQFFDAPDMIYIDENMEDTASAIASGGLTIVAAQEAFPKFTFFDAAGVVFYLHRIPWQINDFSVERYYTRLEELNQICNRDGGFVVREHRYLIIAEKPVQ